MEAVYELRIYRANEGKLEALQARFRDHSDVLLRRHNMKSVGYWLPTDAPHAGNTLIYLLEHPSREEADRNWAAFIQDPDWRAVHAESEKDGSLVAGIDRFFMSPTDFSALK